MNKANITDHTITFTDPETGEEHTIPASDLRIMVEGIAKDCPELGEVPKEFYSASADLSQAANLVADANRPVGGVKPTILEVGEAAKPSNEVRGLASSTAKNAARWRNIAGRRYSRRPKRSAWSRSASKCKRSLMNRSACRQRRR